MSNTTVDPDMFSAPFQLTKSMHRDVYDAVDPSNPSLRVTGKVVVITGAGGGLGYSIASAWSTASAKGIVLVGRNKEKLEETAKDLKVPSLVVSGNVTSESDVDSVFEKAVAAFGKVDVLINAAGTINQGAMTGEVAPSQWWADFESNVKGTYNMIYYFIKSTGGKGTVINIVSLGASFLAPGMSSYSSSKLAAIKFGEYLDLEHPDLRVFSIHPGIVEAEGGRGMVVPNFTPFAKDKGLLTGGVTVYLQTPKADHLRGGFFSVNWDVVELGEHKGEIIDKKLLKLSFLNAKFGPSGYAWSEGEQ